MKYDKTLNLIYSNEVIMRDLRALFEQEVDRNIPEVTTQTNEQLGEQYRAHQQAKRMIEDAFHVLQSYDAEQGTGTGIKYT